MGKLPEISHTLEIPSACSPEGAAQIRDFIQEKGLGRTILAACSCCALDQVCYSCTYQRVRCKGNLGVFTHVMDDLEFVNIREGCAYVHPRARRKATQAAQTLIEAVLSKNQNHDVIFGELPEFQPSTLLIGNGASAGVCQSALEDLNFEVITLPVLSGEITRKGGRYVTPGPDGEVLGDCLVLAPTSAAELDYISREFLREDRHLLVGPESQEGGRRLGIFVCSPALDPEISGKGAAGEVLAWVGRTCLRALEPAAKVDPLLCRSCGTCLEVCGLGIPDLVVDLLGSHAYINPLLCQNCGTCAAHCPSGAIQPGTLTDLEIGETLERVLNSYE
jgi:heterodisulfide reductase subunit A-like polyferredoxin